LDGEIVYLNGTWHAARCLALLGKIPLNSSFSQRLVTTNMYVCMYVTPRHFSLNNHGWGIKIINYLSTGAGFLPSTVYPKKCPAEVLDHFVIL